MDACKVITRASVQRPNSGKNYGCRSRRHGNIRSFGFKKKTKKGFCHSHGSHVVIRHINKRLHLSPR